MEGSDGRGAAHGLPRRAPRKTQVPLEAPMHEAGKWGAEDVACGVRHTVTLFRNQHAKVSGRYLADAAFVRDEPVAVRVLAPVHEPVPEEAGEEPWALPEEDDEELPEDLMPRLDRGLLGQRLADYKAREKEAQEHQREAELASVERARSAHSRGRDEAAPVPKELKNSRGFWRNLQD